MARGSFPFARPAAVHAWDRLDGMWAGVFYVTLGIPTVAVLVDADSTGPRALLLASTAIVAGARELATRWIAREVPGGAAIRFADGARGHVVVGLGWAVVTLVGLIVLVRSEPMYFFALYGLFPQSFVVLPRNWAIAFAGLLVPAVLLAEGGAPNALASSEFLITAVGSILVSVTLGLLGLPA